MAKFSVILHNRLPCNLQPVVLGFWLQIGHQNAAGNLIEVEKVSSAPNTPCNESTQLDSAKQDPNVGILAIIVKVRIGGQEKLFNERLDTSVPGTPLPSPIEAELRYDFDYEMIRGDTDGDKLAENMTPGVKIRFLRVSS